MYRIYKGDGCAAAVTDEMGIAFYKSDISMTCVLWNAEGETIAAARAYDDGRKSEYSFVSQEGSEKVMQSKRGETLAAHNNSFTFPDDGDSYTFTTHSGIYTAYSTDSGDEPVIGYIKGDKYSIKAELVTEKFSVGFEFAGSLFKAANAFEARFENNDGEGLFMDMEGFEENGTV